MIISFIGMSGVGKTYWSKKLEKKGFKRFCVDEMIEEKLKSDLKKFGYKGIKDVAKWMGQPLDNKYKQTSKKYLKFEEEVMQEIINYLETRTNSERVVVDTTGSLIYTDKSLQRHLAKNSKVVYLHAPKSVKREMVIRYVKEPKPIYWGNLAKNKKVHKTREFLIKEYPKLLEYRTKKYQKIAEIFFDYHLIRHKNFTEDVLIDVLKKYDQI